MSIFLNRKSVRSYDENYKISKLELEEMLELTLKAPSSMNLQPTRMLVIESNEAKEKIKPHMFGNLLQVDTSSQLVLFVTRLDKFEVGLDVFNQSEELGFLPRDVADHQRNIIKNRNENYQIEKVINEGHLDTGLQAMQFMLVAKQYGYDTCAIGGFNKDTILSALNIKDDNLLPVLMVSIGKAKEPGFNSFRLSVEDTVEYF